jgi:hypothetical protein
MKIIFLISLLFCILPAASIHSQDWEKELEEIEENRPKLKKENGNGWEDELERDLKEQEKKEKGFQDSRGTTSPIQNQNQLNRSAQNLMMDASVAVDIVGAYDKNKPSTTQNMLDIRTAEFGFSAAVDQWIRGYFLGAAHSEDGKYFYEVHEAWAEFPFLPFNISAKVGMIFLDVGRLNKIHSHDRPFTEAPIVHQKFLDWESIFDTGAEVSILFPWSFMTQELVIGATNGKKWGHAHSAGQKKNNPMVYAHLKNFYYFGNNWGTQFGVTGIRYEPSEDRRNERFLYGIDAVLRWNRSNLKELLIMSEFWYNTETFPDRLDATTGNISSPPRQIQYGYYLFIDYKFHQLWSIGYRNDFITDRTLKDRNGYNARNSIEANSIQITLHTSEFAKVRGTFERRYIRDLSQENDSERVDQRFYFQTMIIMGSHPAHTY